MSDCTSSTVYIFKCIFSLKIIKTKVKLDKIMDLVCWLVALEIILKRFKGTIEWSWLYGSWFYNYLWNQWLSPLTSWVWIPLRWGVLDTTLSDKCQWLETGQWFSPVSWHSKAILSLRDVSWRSVLLMEETTRKTTDLSQVTNKFNHMNMMMLYQVHLTRIRYL